MATVFTKIVNGEIPSYRIAENSKFYAFLDINPLQKGHTLVIPKREVDNFFDLSNEELQEIIVFAKEIAIRIQNSLKCRKVAVSVIGLEVPHAHMHLIPINEISDADPTRQKLELTHEEFEQIQELLTQ